MKVALTLTLSHFMGEGITMRQSAMGDWRFFPSPIPMGEG
jgi:hypothetical protein